MSPSRAGGWRRFGEGHAKDQRTAAAVKALNLQDRVLTLGGRRVRVASVDGTGTPVLLVAGCGLSLEFWLPVADQLRVEHHRPLLAFDRPGLGGTHWPGHEPTLAEEVATLTAALELLDRPAIVVGHSMASFHVEALARTRPDLVAALVLVDGSVEWPAEPPTSPKVGLATLVDQLTRRRLFAVAGQVIWRLGTVVQSEQTLHQVFGPRMARTYRAPGALAMATAEAMAYDQQAWDLVQLRARHPWPGTSTTLLTAANTCGLRQWLDQQQRLAGLLGAAQVVVEGSRHLMMIDRPDAIVTAIAQLDPAPATQKPG